MATWPAEIGFTPLVGTLQDVQDKGHYEFQPDAGSPQRLQTASGLQRTLAFKICAVDATNRARIEAFYRDDCSHGVEQFTAPDPYDPGQTRTYWWEEPPTFTSAGPMHFHVQIKVGTLMP